MRTALQRLVLAVLLQVAAAGCGSIPDPLVSPSPDVSPTRPSDEIRFEVAIRLRSRLGLSTAEDFVRALARDSDAIARGLSSSGYGFPLTEAELRLLEGRARDVKAVKQVMNTYAADHPESWAGMFVQTATGVVVARFTGELPTHRAALARLLHVDARYEVQPARWTKVELDSLADRVRAEELWFRSVDAQLTGSGTDIISNQTLIYVRSNRADIGQIVTDHFDAEGRMRVDVEGPLPWTGPRGNLIVVARDAAGAPVPNLDCILKSDNSSAEGNLLVTDDDGRCRFLRVPAVGMSVVLQGRVGQEVLDFGRAQTTVRAGATVEVVIVVERRERPD